MPVQYDQVRALTVKDVMELFHVPHIRRVKEKSKMISNDVWKSVYDFTNDRRKHSSTYLITQLS